MRLSPMTRVLHFLFLLALLVVVNVGADPHQSKERRYYIAAVEIDWNYSGNDTSRFGTTYKKVVYREYDQDFRQAKTHPSWLGLLGPTLRAEEGDTIVVTFRNMATGVYSIHPHGVAYGKQSEGANYFDNTSQKEKEDDMVLPNGEHVYHWEVTPDVSPVPDDPACLTYTYTSHQNVVQDYNSGLIGALLICKPGSLDDSGKQFGFHQEYVFLFGVFDETASMYRPSGYSPDNHVKYTINGYTRGSLSGVSMCAHAPVSLHMAGMSSEPEAFSVHINGQVMTQGGHKVSSVGLISGSSATASLVAPYAGRWLLSSKTMKHIEAGLHGFVDVQKCDNFEEPSRRMTIAQQRQSKEWTYYIAAEEIIWNFSPNLQDHVDADFQRQYLTKSPTHIGAKYKKAVYTLYTNASFTEKLENKQRKSELGILGPVIRAQIRDVIKVVFRNMASRPYSIYPHGLTIDKSEEGVTYPEGGNKSHAIQPGETHTYVWNVLTENEPLDKDSRCLTRMYHSAVDTPRDIASGLIGPILICKSQSLNVRNVQVRADKEQHAMFSVFDENKSWYLDDNIRQNCDWSKVNKADPDFYKSNVMHTINGYGFESGPLLGFCSGEVATWHVSSVGAQDYIQTATFYGHPFELNDRTEEFLSLYPMTGETIKMNMDNTGVWLLASLNSHETTKGMRLKFQDVVCYNNNDYEYEDEDSGKDFIEWNPPTLDKPKEEEKKILKTPTAEPDTDTDVFAEELGLRSRKNQPKDSDMEELDPSVLEYGTDDPVKNVNHSLSFIKPLNKPEPSNLDALNGSQFSVQLEVNDISFTEPHSQNHSFSGNATHSPSNSTRLISHSFQPKDNTTFFTGQNRLLKNNSTAASKKTVSHPDNVTASAATTTSNAAAALGHRNVSANNVNAALPIKSIIPMTNQTTITQECINVTSPSQQTFAPTMATPGNSTIDSDREKGLSLEDSQEEFTSMNVSSNNLSLSHPRITSQKDIPHTNTSTVTLIQRTTRHANLSSTGLNHSLSVPALDVEEVNVSAVVRSNLTILELKDKDKTSNKSNSIITKDQPKQGLILNASESVTVPTNSSLGNATRVLLKDELFKNKTVNVSILDPSGRSTERGAVITALKNKSTNTSSVGLPHLPMAAEGVKTPSSDELEASESNEEVFIYLEGNRTEVIKTSSIKPQGNNWTYDGTHSLKHHEIPGHMKKYFTEKMPQTTPPPKTFKNVNRRQRPKKGQGMKTKRRKDYRPQPRSFVPPNPHMTPRGSRPYSPLPVSDEEKLINMPVVIGVPRSDFRDYQLYVPGSDPDTLDFDQNDVVANEYEYVSYKDPYSSHEDIKNLNLDETSKYYLKLSGPNVKMYFIAAEEVEWDYAGYGHRRLEKSQANSLQTKFTKVVFRGYLDSSFSTPDIRGEMDEHLGILGPLIKAEVGQSIMVVFKNNAKRPFSLHPNGVSYTKQFEGLSYEDGSKYWYKYDNEVQPNSTFTYVWKVSSTAGPLSEESQCRTWAYYSGVNPERDIHSGLIGPLLVCREGTLSTKLLDMSEFVLLFMTFDESQSWYYDRNSEVINRKSRKRVLDGNHKENLEFHTINGIIYSLKGLRMYTNQLVRWHLLNMGSPKDFQSVHFHGQTFIHKKNKGYRQAVYPLLPGSFATLEMQPSKPGLWQLETEVGLAQQKGMQTLFLVLDKDCYYPLGLESCSVKDNQITAMNTRENWEPHLARLNNQGTKNAWSTEKNGSWIQVDFQRPVVISQIATQGAKQRLRPHFVTKYSISYSNDRRKWIHYKGDSRAFWKVFSGNQEAYETKKNTFIPPVIARFIRLYPINWYNTATLRMEFYGCELDGCSVPLGLENGLIQDEYMTASSSATNWYFGPWKASLGRLNKQGSVNAWRAKNNDINQWLQVELPHIKKITGIITQGAKFMGKEMYVRSYSLQSSENGIHWMNYMDDEDQSIKVS
uniref:ferroxidase n=1 Tax=Nothobranchius furzeri TaxID=105023 RepID=A0A8C6NQD5_NOTFU